jgi:hypothetical protein
VLNHREKRIHFETFAEAFAETLAGGWATASLLGGITPEVTTAESTLFSSKVVELICSTWASALPFSATSYEDPEPEEAHSEVDAEDMSHKRGKLTKGTGEVPTQTR